MNRVQFNAAMQGEVRTLLQKHEHEREAVQARDRYIAESIGRDRSEVLPRMERDIECAADRLNMAICLFSDCIYDLIKGDDSE